MRRPNTLTLLSPHIHNDINVKKLMTQFKMQIVTKKRGKQSCNQEKLHSEKNGLQISNS